MTKKTKETGKPKTVNKYKAPGDVKPPVLITKRGTVRSYRKATKKDGNWTPRQTSFPGRKKTQPVIYSDDLIEKALRANGGLISYACRSIGMDMGQCGTRIRNSPRLQMAMTQARESRCDKAEKVLDTHLGRNNLTAAIYVTKCLGKNRGYVERIEQTDTQAAVDIDAMSDAELTALVEAIAKRLGGAQ